MKRLLLEASPSEEAPPQVSPAQVQKIIRALNNNKAADCYGIASEHLKLAPNISPIVADLLNRIFNKGVIPDDLKIGLATPIPKKEKTQTDPDKFRRITISALLGKVLEKHMVALSDSLDDNQSPLQFGFTRGVSCNVAAMILTESILHCKDLDKPQYVTFMDASKAFDVVDHDSVMLHLHRQGITGNLWKCYNNLYTDITSKIKWQGEESEPFGEGQGIRQGAPTSTGIFKARSNPSLSKLEVHPDNLQIGHLKVGALMVADDLVISSRTIQGMQALVTEAEMDASRERFSFSQKKTRTMVFGAKKSTAEPDIKLYDARLEQSNAETHLGIIRSEKGTNSDTVKERVKTARRTSYSILGAGLHGLNGTGPEVGRHIWNIFVMPRLTYGLEALRLSSTETIALEEYYRRNLRSIQHLPKSTAKPAVYLLMGSPPVEAEIHIRTITFFTNALRRPESLEYQLIHRQLVMKDSTSNSWVWYANHLLELYGLPSAFKLLCYQPPKDKWRATVKKSVLSEWEVRLKSEARNMKTLCFVNLKACSLSEPHPVWALGPADVITVVKASTKVKLMTQRYPLYYSRTAGGNYGHPCPLCHHVQETMEHFLLHCQPLEYKRSEHMHKLKNILIASNIQSPQTDTEWAQIILDPSYYSQARHTTLVLEAMTRDLCFDLHLARSTLLGFPPRCTRRTRGTLLQPYTTQ